MGGIWSVLGVEYNGDLIINENEQRLGLILYCDFDMDLITNDSKIIPKKIEYIVGNVGRKIKYTLIDNRVIKRHGEFGEKCIIYIIAKYCITGIDIEKDQAVFNKMKFKLSDTVFWTGLWGNENLKLKELEESNNYIETIGYKFKKEITVKMNNAYIRFSPICGPYNANIYSKEYIMKQDVAIEIEKENLSSIEEFINILNVIKNFVVFTMRIPIYIIDIKGNNENYMINKSERKYLDIKIYYDEVKKVKDSENIMQRLITFNEISNKITVLKKWFSKYRKLREIVSFYNNNIEYSKTPSYIRFINIAQSLELFHERFICKKPKQLYNRINNYKNCCNKTKIIKKMEKIQNGQKDYIIFENRILDLLFVEYEFNFYEDFGNLDIYKFASKVAMTRHYFVHHNKKKQKYIFDEESIESAIYVLEMLLAYYVLKEIGINKEIVKKIVVEKVAILKFNKCLN